MLCSVPGLLRAYGFFVWLCLCRIPQKMVFLCAETFQRNLRNRYIFYYRKRALYRLSCLKKRTMLVFVLFLFCFFFSFLVFLFVCVFVLVLFLFLLVLFLFLFFGRSEQHEPPSARRQKTKKELGVKMWLFHFGEISMNSFCLHLIFAFLFVCLFVFEMLVCLC